jgi:hypothetical protein
MGVRDGKSLSALGFLTVVRHEQHGLFGGYLLLNAAGRPLEFHCTTPLKPNRAQEILFGPTLEPYLYGEQIGQTLFAKAETKPMVVCTDVAPMLAVRDHISAPVVMVAEKAEETASVRFDAAHSLLPDFHLGRHRLFVAPGFVDDRTLVTERLATLAEHFDLREPFGRIREAIEEAQRSR